MSEEFIRKMFKPQPDISARELAEIWGHTGSIPHSAPVTDGVVFRMDVWTGLPAAIQRHWIDP